jgi:hypothetical protein
VHVLRRRSHAGKFLGFRTQRVKRDPITKTPMTFRLSVHLSPGCISWTMIVRQFKFAQMIYFCCRYNSILRCIGGSEIVRSDLSLTRMTQRSPLWIVAQFSQPSTLCVNIQLKLRFNVVNIIMTFHKPRKWVKQLKVFKYVYTIFYNTIDDF